MRPAPRRRPSRQLHEAAATATATTITAAVATSVVAAVVTTAASAHRANSPADCRAVAAAGRGWGLHLRVVAQPQPLVKLAGLDVNVGVDFVDGLGDGEMVLGESAERKARKLWVLECKY
jgi:hypothetical protein